MNYFLKLIKIFFYYKMVMLTYFKSYWKILLFGLLILLTECNYEEKTINNSDVKLYFNASEWDVKKVIPGELIKEISYIPLETRKECMLGEIKKILVCDDIFYIQDRGINKKIFLYNFKGEYIKSIGEYGKGYGEYLNLSDFIINKDKEQILILDSSQGKVFAYDQFDGVFIEEYKIDFYANNFVMVNENLIAFYSKFNNFRKEKKYSIAFYDLENKSTDWFMEQDEYDTRASYPHSFFQSENIYYTSFFRDIVFEIKANKVIPYIKFDFGNSKIPLEKIRMTQNDGEKIYELMKSDDWTYGIQNVLETENILALDFNLNDYPIEVLYSKITGEYVYGSRYELGIEASNLFNHITVINNKFLSAIDAFQFKNMENVILKRGNSEFQSRYKQILYSLSEQSNPIIRLVEYSSF